VDYPREFKRKKKSAGHHGEGRGFNPYIIESPLKKNFRRKTKWVKTIL